MRHPSRISNHSDRINSIATLDLTHHHCLLAVPSKIYIYNRSSCPAVKDETLAQIARIGAITSSCQGERICQTNHGWCRLQYQACLLSIKAIGSGDYPRPFRDFS